MKRVLFLDFDGPVVNERSQLAFPTGPVHRSFDPVAMALVNRLCRDTDCRVVVSSNWRSMHNVTDILRVAGLTGKFFGHDDLEANDMWGQSLGRRDLCITPFVEAGEALRGREIRAWLVAHPEVVSYAILDDLDVLPEDRDHLVQVDVRNGFSAADFYRATALLS